MNFTPKAFVCQNCGETFCPPNPGRTHPYCSRECKNDPIPRFWQRVRKTETCWLWTGQKKMSGYGFIDAYGQEFVASRFSWLLEYGELPPGLFVLHRCDNPACVRPSHLFLGNQDVNVADRHRKGRDARGERHMSRTHPELVTRGEKCHTAKLTEDQVRTLRRRYAEFESPGRLAREYGITPAQVRNIGLRLSWKHVA